MKRPVPSFLQSVAKHLEECFMKLTALDVPKCITNWVEGAG